MVRSTLQTPLLPWGWVWREGLPASSAPGIRAQRRKTLGPVSQPPLLAWPPRALSQRSGRARNCDRPSQQHATL